MHNKPSTLQQYGQHTEGVRRGNSVGIKSQVRVLLGLHYLNTPYESESNLKCYSIAYKNHSHGNSATKT